MILLPITTITTPGTVIGTPILLPGGSKELTAIADFVFGSGGVSVKCFVQTLIGQTWMDIMNLFFTTASEIDVGVVHEYEPANPNPFTPTDGTMGNDTIKNGVLGLNVRIKLITLGTYAGGTTIRVDGNV